MNAESPLTYWSYHKSVAQLSRQRLSPVPGLRTWVRFYLGVVSGVELLGDWGDVVLQELQPLLFVADLVHVDVHGGDVLVAAGETLVLLGHRKEGQVSPPLGANMAARLGARQPYLVGSSGPLAVVLHGLHQLVTHLLREDGEPVDVRTGLQDTTSRRLDTRTRTSRLGSAGPFNYLLHHAGPLLEDLRVVLMDELLLPVLQGNRDRQRLSPVRPSPEPVGVRRAVLVLTSGLSKICHMSGWSLEVLKVEDDTRRPNSSRLDTNMKTP